MSKKTDDDDALILEIDLEQSAFVLWVAKDGIRAQVYGTIPRMKVIEALRKTATRLERDEASYSKIQMSDVVDER